MGSQRQRLMVGKALELHGATFGDGEVAGGNDECPCAAIRGYYAGVRVLSQRGKQPIPLPVLLSRALNTQSRAKRR